MKIYFVYEVHAPNVLIAEVKMEESVNGIEFNIYTFCLKIFFKN